MFRPSPNFVIAGLDPAIHQNQGVCLRMDARVKPGHDD
jgi:hypothetical protein